MSRTVDVTAVVGACAPERRAFADTFARSSRGMLVTASQVAHAPDPLDEALAIALWAEDPGGAVVEFATWLPITHAIGALTDESSQTRLREVICVVDASHLLTDLLRDDYVPRPGLRSADGRRLFTARALLTATQIEFASIIELVNWHPLSTPDLSTVMALVSHLSPHARLHLQDEATVLNVTSGSPPYSAAQERPGWVSILNNDCHPHMTDSRVTALRYEHLRPLHPGRLAALLDGRVEAGEFGTVVRSSGFCRLATRSSTTMHWDQVGRMISFDPLISDYRFAEGEGEEEEMLAVGQDLAFIGLDLDVPALTEALDDTALTDAEFAAGPIVWRRLPDPFPERAHAQHPPE